MNTPLSFVTKIPAWLVRHLCGLDEGSRWLSKKPTSYWQTPIRGFQPVADRRLPTHYGTTSKTPITDEGNLPLNDYRFWVGAKLPDTKFSLCRWCRTVRYSLDSRRVHQRKESNCTKNLRTIYDILLDGSLCVVCRAYTNDTKWGIPLCSAACTQRWMYELEMYPLMEEAREEAQGLGALLP